MVAIDGPAAAGKSTVAQLVAERLGFVYFDTGVLYRAITWKALQTGVPLNDEGRVREMVQSTKIEVRFPRERKPSGVQVLVDGRDVTQELRTPEVDRHVSIVAAMPTVRQALVGLQRWIGERGGTVMAGRDIGTVIFPDAPVKIFLVASPEERARRRVRQLAAEGKVVDYQQVLREILRRDQLDAARAVAPLAKAPDAIEIVTDNLTLEQVVEKVIEVARQKLPPDP